MPTIINAAAEANAAIDALVKLAMAINEEVATEALASGCTNKRPSSYDRQASFAWDLVLTSLFINERL